MAEFKTVIADPKEKKAYQKVLTEDIIKKVVLEVEKKASELEKKHDS